MNKNELRKGVYICRCGGNISDVVACEKVAKAAENLDGVVVSRVETFMCSDPAQETLIADIKNHNLDRVVIASCSPSLHELTFRNALKRAEMNPYLYEHVNIREQVSWVHGSQPDQATEKATRLIAGALKKVEGAKALETLGLRVAKRALVVGGGVAGLRAAKDLADRGIEVTLVERSPFLGGRMAQLGTLFPTGEKSRDLLGRLIAEVTEDPKIDVLTSSSVNSVDGYVGNFKIAVETKPRYVRPMVDAGKLAEALEKQSEDHETDDEFNYGLTKRKALRLPYPGCWPPFPALDEKLCGGCEKAAEMFGDDVIDANQKTEKTVIDAGGIIVATGFAPYQPSEGEFGFGRHPEVITLPQLMRLLDEEGPSKGELSLNGRPIGSVAIIHCVGSRQIEGIHQPKEDKSLNTYCSRVCCTASLQAAIEIKERFSHVNVFEFFKDIRSYGKYHEEYYEKASRSRVLFFKYGDDRPPVVEADPHGEGALRITVKDQLTWGHEISVPADLVVLATGMEPRDISELVGMLKLPVGADGFLREVHPKLRPVELAVQGVMVAGTAQAPMNIDEASSAASAAAAKAFKILTKDEIRLDPYVAVVDADLCEGSGQCVAQCEYSGALRLVDVVADGKTVKRAQVNEAICKGCGSCVPACPHNAIDIAGSALSQLYDLIDGFTLDLPDIASGANQEGVIQ